MTPKTRTRNRRTLMVHGLLLPSFGPVVRVELFSPTGSLRNGLAVLDTGASMSAIDKEVAHTLQLPTFGAAEWAAVTADGARPVSALRRAQLGIADQPRRYELDLIEVPNLRHLVDGFLVVALLGWDFLGKCRLSCDGPRGMFELELP